MFLGSCAFSTSLPPLLANKPVVSIGFSNVLSAGQSSYAHPVILQKRECEKQSLAGPFNVSVPRTFISREIFKIFDGTGQSGKDQP